MNKIYLQFLVGVVVQAGVLGHLVLGDADARRGEHSLPLARLRRLQAQVLHDHTPTKSRQITHNNSNNNVN